MKRNLLVFVVLAIAVGAVALYGAPPIPTTMNYQGVLTDSLGSPLPDGTYLIHFTLYYDSNGVSQQWTESQDVTVSNGFFEVQLGADNPLDLDIFDLSPDIYLGVALDGEKEMRPLTQLTSQAFAWVAVRATVAHSLDLNSVNSNNIVDGSISFVDIGQNSAATGEVIKWNGSAWEAQPDASDPGGWLDEGAVVRLSAVNDSVGIGTSAPQEKLTVNGKIQSKTGGFRFPDGSIQTTACDADGHSLDAVDGSPTDAVYVRYDGNVGIGTNSPTSKLVVDGNSYTMGTATSVNLEVATDAEIGGDIEVEGRINNAAFRSGACGDGSYSIAVDMAGAYDDQGEVHFGSTVDDQWVDCWFIYSHGRLMGNYIKYNGSTITTGHFNLTDNGTIALSGASAAVSAASIGWNASTYDVMVFELNASNNTCEWWSYDRRN